MHFTINSALSSLASALERSQVLRYQCPSHVRAYQASVESSTAEVHPLLLEHTGLDPCAARWTSHDQKKLMAQHTDTHRKESSWHTLDNHRNMRAAAGPFCLRDWR